MWFNKPDLLQWESKESFYIRDVRWEPQYIVRTDTKSPIEKYYSDTLGALWIKRLSKQTSSLNYRFRQELEDILNSSQSYFLSTEHSVENEVWLSNIDRIIWELEKNDRKVEKIFSSLQELKNYIHSLSSWVKDIREWKYMIGVIPDSHFWSIEKYILLSNGSSVAEHVNKIIN